ncbi:ABC transporter permease [Vampirovibrio chlorellavorus]|uniref:ABC transporter permease n=1 Tax=Vampirovibrio chlorellavorus TaxID=758823 RepID=UPI0026F228B6|nr:ABC transporter permease [Vampirovibrio chlorellavorus]
MLKKQPNTPELNLIRQMYQRLYRDRVAFVSLLVLVGLYLMVALADFLAPYSESRFDRSLAKAPPTPVYMLDEAGGLSWPYVFRYEKRYNPATFTQEFTPILSEKYPIRLFPTAEPYRLFGLIPGTIRLFGVDAPAQISLLGNDINGRDVFSRMLYGGQISLTIGFLSLFVVFPIGMIYGGLAGYFGGKVDDLMMRVAEIVMSIPSFFLLIGLAAILPPGLPSTQRFALVVLILAFIGWAGLSRVIRGMVLSIKNEEFVESSRAIGMNPFTIIVRHILPQTTSYLMVALTLSVPGYILAESGLSFLGLGIQQPDASWGNMLKEAQDISNIIERPWMLMPGFLIFLAVLAFNVVGDAVRDILDPKSRLARK